MMHQVSGVDVKTQSSNLIKTRAMERDLISAPLGPNGPRGQAAIASMTAASTTLAYASLMASEW